MRSGQISDRLSRGAVAYFLLTGVIFATWASRVPAIKGGLDLSDGQFAIALLGLEAGAVLGLQLGGLIVPRVGSRRALTTSLAVFVCVLLGPAFAPSLLLLAASLFAFAALNSVVDVAMNTQGLALQRLMGRPVLSRLHAMHSLGGVIGAGAGALAARLGAASTLPRLCHSGSGGGSRRLATALALEIRRGGGWNGGRWRIEALVRQLVGFHSLAGRFGVLLHAGRGRWPELVHRLRHGVFGRNRSPGRGVLGRLPGCCNARAPGG